MPAALPLRSDFDNQTLRDFARRCENSNQSRRLLSLAAVYDGMSRTQAARIGGMDRQTLRHWVLRFNADGPEGLLDRWSPGPARRLSDDQLRELAGIVETGPDMQTDGVVRWRRVDLQAVIKEYFGVDYGARWVSQILHDLGFSHMSARPQHPKQNAKVIKVFKKTSPAHLPRI
jgi:transposase